MMGTSVRASSGDRDDRRTAVTEMRVMVGEDRTITRVDLLRGAGRLVVGTIGIGGLGGLLAACGDSTGSSSASGSGGASKAKSYKVAVIEQEFGPFFADNFETPAKDYLKAKAPASSVTFGNEANTVTTGINLLKQYAANGYDLIILSTGDEMSAWERSVQDVVKQGTLFINHSTQGVAGATQNVLFSHKQAGVDIGNAAAEWAKANGISAPTVGLVGNLSDAQGSKRTTWAWNTIKEVLPDSKLAGKVQGIDTEGGSKAAANLISAHPDVNVLITFNTVAGTGAMTAATHAGKKDPKKFFLGTTDSEDATLKLIADGGTIYQANWGAFFPASMDLMLKDGLAKLAGGEIQPTRLILGLTITKPEQASSFKGMSFKPLDPANEEVFTKYFKYLDTPVGTAEVPEGQ
jgi:ABC-type sugar transport system substrate-binding protein